VTVKPPSACSPARSSRIGARISDGEIGAVSSGASSSALAVPYSQAPGAWIVGGTGRPGR
jgi:hypothetical protein